MGAIRARVGPCASGHHHEHIGYPERALSFRLVVFVDQPPDFQKMFRSRFDFMAAKHDFDQGVASVFEVENGVGRQTVAIPIVGKRPSEGTGIDDVFMFSG